MLKTCESCPENEHCMAHPQLLQGSKTVHTSAPIVSVCLSPSPDSDPEVSNSSGGSEGLNLVLLFQNVMPFLIDFAGNP